MDRTEVALPLGRGAVARLRKVRALVRVLLAEPDLGITDDALAFLVPYLNSVCDDPGAWEGASDELRYIPKPFVLRALEDALDAAIAARVDTVARNAQALGTRLGLSNDAVGLLVLCLDARRNPLQTALVVPSVRGPCVGRHCDLMAAALRVPLGVLSDSLAELDAHGLCLPVAFAQIRSRDVSPEVKASLWYQLDEACTLDPSVTRLRRRVRI